ncbi:DNA-binding NarL/FixJ family response regulator [Buttiauxella sp. BIGb0471]|uniref:helix-turn-helix domain-containing protein n=1 Tax=Buttiauxella sp. BIGb0471 TaxID=2940597 RepID=UPI002168DA97|nr:helix-turn-helix transcriptional regulator [Buttiauxella sp. BIGb0471]MCS3601670.1 DNA-binding NarL/FixJ family response regulator [Buttiauxella sp. BIGb0471]
MLNIAIDDSNTFYRYGLERFLENIFLIEKNKVVKFQMLTKLNINEADVVVQNFVAGEEYSCHYKLKYRSKPGLVIGLYEKERGKILYELPNCIRNVVIINRTDSMSDCRDKIISAWDEVATQSQAKDYRKCFSCKYLTLTSQQLTIAKKMLHGQDISQIAQALGINVKTVSAHKRLIMQKFNLRNDFELMHLLYNMKSHNPPIHLYSWSNEMDNKRRGTC